MDIEKALKLTKASDLERACIDAETRNVEWSIKQELRRRYYAAVEKEEIERLQKQRGKKCQ